MRGNRTGIRQGLKGAGLDDGWVELLAVRLVPDPGWRTKKLYKFLCPRWLAVNIVTGVKHRMNCLLVGGVFDFCRPASYRLVDEPTTRSKLEDGGGAGPIFQPRAEACEDRLPPLAH